MKIMNETLISTYAIPGIKRELLEEKPKRELTIDYIVTMICGRYKISTEKIKSKNRKRELVEARQIAMYLTSKHTSLSLKSIGEYFNKRDHTTVIHSKNTVMDLRDTDEKYRVDLQNIEDSLYL